MRRFTPPPQAVRKPKTARQDEPIWNISLEADSVETEMDQNTLNSQRADVLIRAAALFALEVGDTLVVERTAKGGFRIVVIDAEKLVKEATSL